MNIKLYQYKTNFNLNKGVLNPLFNKGVLLHFRTQLNKNRILK